MYGDLGRPDIIPVLKSGLAINFGQMQFPGITLWSNGIDAVAVERGYQFEWDLAEQLSKIAGKYRVTIRLTKIPPVESLLLECYVTGQGVSCYGLASLFGNSCPLDDQRVIEKISEAFKNALRDYSLIDGISQEKRLG